MSRSRATLIGYSAALMWALLGALTAASGRVSPFQLAAMTFAVGGILGFAWLAATRSWRDLKQPPAVWLLGLAGLFGYHALYFTALRNAPPVEASLIAYLWPLLVVVLSALLPGERLRAHHLVGAGLGLSGTALIVLGGGGLAFDDRYALGYLAALGCALTWSSYSVASRRFAAVPTGIVAGYCLGTALLSIPAHLVFEETVWPANATEWLAVLGLGLMPVGAAFYAWDIGVKHGDIQGLGVFSFVSPLISALILIVAGFGAFTWTITTAAVLITVGALIASKDVLSSRSAGLARTASLMLIAGLILAANPAQAKEPRAFWTGQTLYENCTGGDLPVCVGYVMAILDATNLKEFGAVSIQRFSPAYPHYCFPEGEDIGSAVDAVVAFLRDHPEARRSNASRLTMVALSRAYPCGHPLGRRAGQRPKGQVQQRRR